MSLFNIKKKPVYIAFEHSTMRQKTIQNALTHLCFGASVFRESIDKLIIQDGLAIHSVIIFKRHR